MEQRFTRTEVERMTGAKRQQLDYWSRLGLVRPLARWGERFFSFSDLVAVETLRRLATQRVPAGRLRRTMDALTKQLGGARAPLSSLRISVRGEQIVVHEPGADGRPLEPLTGQLVLDFETAPLKKKLRVLGQRTAEEWFEMGMAWDTNEQTLGSAVDAYRHAVEASPEWVEAHINLGTTLFQLGRLEEARKAFYDASDLDPANSLARFNLGCTCDRLGDTESAIHEFRLALAKTPHMADAHLNLGLAYEKTNRKADALRHFALYLRYEPAGNWADFARKRLEASRRSPSRNGKVTRFRSIQN